MLDLLVARVLQARAQRRFDDLGYLRRRMQTRDKHEISAALLETQGLLRAVGRDYRLRLRAELADLFE